MKVYLILVQASYDDGFGIHLIFSNEEKAIIEAKKLNENKKSKYDEYWVEEYEVQQ